MNEEEVVRRILDLYPGLGDHAGYVLWNHACYPLCDPEAVTVTDEGNLAHWLKQIGVYVDDMKWHWQRLHG